MRSSRRNSGGPPEEKPLTASALREQLNIFAADTLQRELEQLKASIIDELSRNKISIIDELSRNKISVLAEISQVRAGIVQDVTQKRASMHEEREHSVGRSVSDVSEHRAQSKQVHPNCDLDRQDKQPLLDQDDATIDALEEVGGHGVWASPSFQKLSHFVQGNVFDTAASFFVIASVVWVTWVTQYTATRWLADPPRTFVWVEVFFCFVFGIELVLRLLVCGVRGFFCSAAWQSNIFDFSLVVLQVLDTFIELSGSSSAIDLSWAPFIRVLRLFRIFRLIRIFRFFPDLRMLVVSVLQSFQPLLWVFALIFFITAVFAIVVTVIVNEYKTKVSFAEWQKKDELEQDLQEFFGSVERSALTLYGAIAGGRDWHESSLPLMKFIDERLIFVFVVYTFFVIFAMMNVVTSQFVDTALEASAKDRRESMVSNLMDTFSKSSDSGMVTEEDFMKHLDTKSMKAFFKDLYKRDDVSAAEIRHSRLFEMLDDDASGAVTKEELVLGCVKLTGNATSLDLAVLKLDVQETRKDIELILEKVTGTQRGRGRSRPVSEAGSVC